MTQPQNDILERLARVLEEAGSRRPTHQEYKLKWTPMVPYTQDNIMAVSFDEIKSCVYELWSKENGTRTAVYVGETQDLGKRLDEHTKDTEENEHLKAADYSVMFFSFALVDGLVARKSVERALWKLYKHEWNDPDGPKGMGVEGQINLIEYFPEPYIINFNGARKAMTGVSSPVNLP